MSGHLLVTDGHYEWVISPFAVMEDVLANVLHILQHISRLRRMTSGINWIHQLERRSASEVKDDLPSAKGASDRKLGWC